LGYRITFELDSFDDYARPDTLDNVVDTLCEALAEANAQWLLENPYAPLLYNSGVYYKPEPPGREEFFDIPRILRQGYADCEDLAAWRAAELVVRFGIAAETFSTYQIGPMGNVMFHVQVKTRYGIEDPSVFLGMRKYGE